MTASVPLRRAVFYRNMAQRVKADASPVRGRAPRPRGAWLTGVLVLLAGITACAPEAPVLKQVQARGELRVATLNAPTSYFLGTQGAEGLEYELARRYADKLGVRLKIITAADRRGLKAALAEGRADLAAAQLTSHRRWAKLGVPAEPYAQVPLHWVYRRGQPRPANTRALAKLRIVVLENTAASDYLDAHGTLDGIELHWEVLPRRAGMDALDAVRLGEADVTLVDGNEYAFARPLHPDTAIAFTATLPRDTQWIVRRDAPDLLESVNAFFRAEASSGRLKRILAEALQPPPDLERNTLREFSQLVESRLAELLPLFEQASVQTGVDWRLLAALAYQESRWNPAARSPNGALGIMMLMPDTARSLGVTDPMDARQSIEGGARYFLKVREQIPKRIREPDRSWFAIASYNMGYGHLEDARIITQTRGGNPDLWEDVGANLPLLSDEAWYLTAKNGSARGWEAFYTVERVREFAKVLEWRTAPVQRQSGNLERR